MNDTTPVTADDLSGFSIAGLLSPFLVAFIVLLIEGFYEPAIEAMVHYEPIAKRRVVALAYEDTSND